MNQCAAAGCLKMVPTELMTINADSLSAGIALDVGHFGPVLRGTYEYCAPEQSAKQIPVARESDDENSEQQRLVCQSTDKILEFVSVPLSNKQVFLSIHVVLNPFLS